MISEIAFELSDIFLSTSDDVWAAVVVEEVVVGRLHNNRVVVAAAEEVVAAAVVLRSRIAVAVAVAVSHIRAGVPIRDVRGVLCQFRDQECICRGYLPICPILESRQVACPVFRQLRLARRFVH